MDTEWDRLIYPVSVSFNIAWISSHGSLVIHFKMLSKSSI